MTEKVTCDDCYRRGDGQWAVIYRVRPGAQRREALSPVKIDRGHDIYVKDGRVVL